MFDKRLLAMVPGAAKYILANVLFQWIALVCNIALFIVIGLFLIRKKVAIREMFGDLKKELAESVNSLIDRINKR